MSITNRELANATVMAILNETMAERIHGITGWEKVANRDISEVIDRINDAYMIPSYFFYGLSFSEISAASSPCCEYIGSHAFQHCDKLLYALFPECRYIGTQAFGHCSLLSQVSFPKLSYISNYAFYCCSNLLNADFSVCSMVHMNAFENCIMLKIASFPECSYVGSSAFQSCYQLSEIYFPKCEQLMLNVFDSCSFKTANFPCLSYISNYAFRACTKLESMYLLNSSMCKLGSSTALAATPMQYSSYIGKYGSIFIPQSLYTDYVTDSVWSWYADRIVGI